jgi:hypothetical protein
MIPLSVCACSVICPPGSLSSDPSSAVKASASASNFSITGG